MKTLQFRGNDRRIFYIDGENNVESLLTGIEALDPNDSVIVFHRENLPAQAKERIEGCCAHKKWICCMDHGIRNSLDFQLVAEISLQARNHEPPLTYIISQDKGFIAAANYLNRTLFEGESMVEVHPSVSSALGSCATRAIKMVQNASSPSDASSALQLLLGSRARGRIESILKCDREDGRSLRIVAI